MSNLFYKLLDKLSPLYSVQIQYANGSGGTIAFSLREARELMNDLLNSPYATKASIHSITRMPDGSRRINYPALEQKP